MTDDRFRLVGVRPQSPAAPVRRAPWYRGKPIFSAAVLALIVLGCLFCEVLLTHDPTYLDLAHCNEAPSREFLFGTDPMGRDIFSMIWYGGRISLTIGVLSTLLSTAIAILFGTVSGCAPDWLDRLLMRLTEILLSVPNLLLVVLLQAILGTANVLTLSLVIGLTSWASIEYVLASRCMGGGFFHVLRQHLAPNFFSSISFMVVMNIRSAITAESTLSFLGIGLPIEVVSWGSMLSLSEKALLTDAWWIIVIPGVFLVATLLCITELANTMRRSTRERTL